VAERETRSRRGCSLRSEPKIRRLFTLIADRLTRKERDPTQASSRARQTATRDEW